MNKKCTTKGCKRTFTTPSFSNNKKMCDACGIKRLGHKKYVVKKLDK